YAQRDAAGVWPLTMSGEGRGTPAALAAWREQLLVFFPTGRYGLFGPADPVIAPSPVPAWTPVAVCEDGLAVDAFGWDKAGDPIHARFENGQWEGRRMQVVIETAKVRDPVAVRFRDRLYLVWREEVPTFSGPSADRRVAFVYKKEDRWHRVLSRLRVASAPLVAAAGDDLVCLYRKPAGANEGPWTLATYATADEDFHEAGELAGPIPAGPVAIARQGGKLYVLVAPAEGPKIATLDVRAVKVGDFLPVPMGEPSGELIGNERVISLALMAAMFAGVVLLLAWRFRGARERRAVGGAAEAPPPIGASLVRRGAALAIDYFLIGLLLAPFILAVGPDSPARFLRGEPVPWQKMAMLELVRLGLVVLYFTVAEGATGRTLGKAILGIEVRGENGGAITWKQSVVRNVTRLVDEMPAFYLLGLASILIGPRRQRVGDRFARTLVVRRVA
ncbi:MAG: RDD family protein, partial [Phycisphaerae bacterium]